MWSPLRFEAVCLLEYLATSCADDLGGHRRLVRLEVVHVQILLQVEVG